MRAKTLAVTLFLMIIGKSAWFNLQAEAQSQARAAVPATQTTRYDGVLPLTFEANQGQAAPPVNFLSRSKGYTALLTADGMILSLRSAPGTGGQPSPATSSTAAGHSSNTILRFKLIGAASRAAAVGEGLQPGKVNYFIGNDSTKWHTSVPTYARVRYRNVYPGIDLVYYGNNRQLEYDFAVSPGADPSRIQFEITGANSPKLDSQGNLVLNTEGGELHFQTPMVYQESNGVRVPVQGEYVMNDSAHIGFHLSAFDPTKPIVIDPVLVYATYLDGSATDEAAGIAVDATGNVYVSGYAESTDFPLVERPMRTSPPDTTKVFVAKLDPTGSTLIYADYFGGDGNDQAYALTLDGANEAYVTGSTSSGDFPLVNPYQSSLVGTSNAFIMKISADGSSLLYSTYFGGNGSDTPASIALDSSSDIFIAGTTTSTNLPVANAYQSSAPANQGGVYGYYGFLTKFNSDGSQLLYSTYFAGNNTNPANNCSGTSCWPVAFSAITGLTLDSSGNAYIGGNTNTNNFPATANVYQPSISASQSNLVGFVGEFDNSGGLTYSTYFYESSGTLTTITAIAVDSSGSAYVTGRALSDGTFPVTSTTICNPSTSGEACSYAYVAKFDAAASTLLYATFLGVNNLASPTAIALDANDDAYVLSFTSTSTFGIVNGIEMFSSEGTDGASVLLAEIDPNADAELFATYLGGSGNNTSAAMTLDANGNIYVAGTTDSTDFPVSQGSFQQNLGGNTDAFIAKIAPASAAAVSLSPFSLQYSAQAVGTTSSSQAVLLQCGIGNLICYSNGRLCGN